MLDKHIRTAMKIPAPPKNPYVALMEPMVIVPERAEEKVITADAGSILRLMDQSALYRDWISPVTRRADEILVQYGKPKDMKLGWITNKQHTKIMKPTRGPTFLVNTKAEDKLIAWEQLRRMVALTRKKDPTNWIAPWLVTHGSQHQKLLREVTRHFGGKPKKNEGTEARITRLFTLILNTELDMATAKNSKSKKKGKGKKNKDTETKSKKSGSKKSAKKDKAEKSSSKQDDAVIVRLVKENPRRAGSAKAKLWDKLKKGMTVAEFVEKGGSRASVARYVENGWVKLRKSGA